MADQPNVFTTGGLDAATVAALMNKGDNNNGMNSILSIAALRMLMPNGFDNNGNTVEAALAQNNQANNNAMLLLKDIQDSSQGVTAAVTASGMAIQSAVTAGQIASLQGQGTITTAVADTKYTAVNEIHEAATDVIASNTANTAQLAATVNSLASSLQQGHADISKEIMQSKYDNLLALKATEGVIRDDIRALKESIPSARELEWQTKYLAEREDNHHNRTRGSVDSGNTTVTNNISQAVATNQNQNILMARLDAITADLQRNTNSTIAIGSVLGNAAQTATNVRQ